MNILHIACTNGDMCNGVQVVVPQHLTSQLLFENIGFINISNIKVKNFNNQFEWKKNYNLKNLPKPFNKPNIVIFHEAYRIQYIIIAWYLRKFKIPYIIVPHGELSEGAQKKKYLKKKIANLLLFNKFVNKSLAIQCLSSVEMNSTFFKATKFIGTNGINIPSRKKNIFSSEAIRFVYIGRLDAYHKGLDLMIEAFSNNKELLKSHKCVLDIYGPDKDGRLDTLKELVKKNNLETIIHLHDAVFDEEKIKALLNADVFIQTSRFEGMPMGILEAMSYGLPCLVSKGTTLADFISQNNAGWACENNSISIGNALKQCVINKNEFLEKSENSRNAAKNYFGWENISKHTINQYKTLMENKMQKK